MKIRICLLAGLLSGLSVWACPLTKDWTFLFFVGGDEATLKRPTEIMMNGLLGNQAFQTSQSVQALIQVDTTDSDSNPRYFLGKGGPRLLTEEEIRKTDPGFSYGEKDSGNAITLKQFLQWAVRAYPSKHYVLVLSGHAWGQAGVLQDFFVKGSKPQEATMIRLYELRRLMEELYREQKLQPFDALVIDACIGGQLDILSELKDVFRYFFASALETPNIGIPFWRVFDHFIPVANGFSEINPLQADQLFEEHFLKPLVLEYVRSHSPGGELASLEKEFDVVEAFALRARALGHVETALRELVQVIPQKTFDDWKNENLAELETISDMDRNADLHELSSRFMSLFEKEHQSSGDPQWENAYRAGSKLRDSLGYGVNDYTMEPTRLLHQDALGAWVHLDIDPMPNTPIAVCSALKSIGMSNGLLTEYLPVFIDKEGNTLEHRDLACHPEEHGPGEESPPTPLDDRHSVQELFEYRLSWPHNIAGYVYDTGESNNRKRVLSLWFQKKETAALDLSLRLRLAGSTHLELDYLSQDPVSFIEQKGNFESLVLQHQSSTFPALLEVAQKELLTSPFYQGQDGLYVAEAHSNGTPFKRGLGILLTPEYTNDFFSYAHGRVPVEQVEASPFSMSLENYFKLLENKGELEVFPVREVQFYDLHRIKNTLWSRFLFGSP